MKKCFYLLLFPILAVMCACGDDDAPVDSPVGDVNIIFSPESLDFAYSADTRQISVTSDADWGLSSDQSWCKYSPTGGIKGTTTVKITVEKNSTDDMRTATLTFKSGNSVKRYTVTQKYDIKEVSIPDAVFKSYCLSIFDTDHDGAISKKEAKAVTSISVPSKSIASLEGIGSFTSITSLDCKGNRLENLDVSALKQLKNLNCADNKLTGLDISANINLSSLDCTGNAGLTKVLVWTGFKPTDAFKIPAAAQYVEPEISTPAGYTLVWQDEFNDACLAGGKPALPNMDEWWYETAEPGWVNNELQRYISGFSGTDTCSVISDGTLKIIAKKKGNEIISARINTDKSWTYGYFEARLKLPQGKGTWPAFWMMPKNYKAWPDDGEIDIMEEVGYRPNYVSSSIHCKAYYHSIGTQKTGEQYVATAESDFHVYALEWTEDYIKGFVDGKCHFTFNNDKKGNKDTWPFDAPFYLKLNLAWGGDWGGAQGVDESKLPATYEIDYVRVFQKK